VTADLDYPRLLALSRAAGPGVILFRGGSYSDAQMLALLDRVLGQLSAAEIERSVTMVDQRRIRRRGLPIESRWLWRRRTTPGLRSSDKGPGPVECGSGLLDLAAALSVAISASGTLTATTPRLALGVGQSQL
jgi:hypothetical protein